MQGAVGADRGEPASPASGAGLLAQARSRLRVAAPALAALTLCAAMACAAARAGHWSLCMWLLAEAALTPALVVIALALLRLMDRLADAGAAALRGTQVRYLNTFVEVLLLSCLLGAGRCVHSCWRRRI